MEERKFFPKKERLFLQKDIDRLFNCGQIFVSYPLRIVYLTVSDNITLDARNKANSLERNEKPVIDHLTSEYGVSALISIPKRRIRKAVKRNRLKRLIRESFRLNKHETVALYKQKEKQLFIAFMYLSNDVKQYSEIDKAVQKALERIRRKEEEASPTLSP